MSWSKMLFKVKEKKAPLDIYINVFNIDCEE